MRNQERNGKPMTAKGKVKSLEIPTAIRMVAVQLNPNEWIPTSASSMNFTGKVHLPIDWFVDRSIM